MVEVLGNSILGLFLPDATRYRQVSAPNWRCANLNFVENARNSTGVAAVCKGRILDALPSPQVSHWDGDFRL